MILKIKNDYYRQTTSFFDFENPPIDPVKIMNDLTDTMIANGAVGLSANQVGIPYSVFVMGNPLERDGILCMFNPVIVNMSGLVHKIEETCISEPGIKIKVPRSETIRFRAANWNNIIETTTFNGLSSRIFQKQYDILNGLTIFSRVSRLRRDRAVRQRRKSGGEE